ncbi:MAG: helix-turn-helix domain-containing protein, partial [Planctomycetota bacterium]
AAAVGGVPEAEGDVGVAAVDASESLADAERRLVVEALDATGWNVSAAARRLGVSRDIVRYRVRKFGLSRPPLGRAALDGTP